VSAEDVLHLLVGLVQIALVAVLVRHLPRYGRAFPWLALLAAYFGVRAVDRIYAAFAGVEIEVFGYVTDALVLLALALLLLGVERMARGLRLVEDEARIRESEYERALSDYRTLARHRLANPITAIRGGVATLKDVEGLDPSEVRALLEMIEREAQELEQISLDPRQLRPEEASLRPRPQV
jgi:signal transduction histidine kinase